MISEMVSCLDRTVAFVRDQVEDLADEEMALLPAGAPNHAEWTLGHIVYSCQAMAVELGVAPWLPSDWESRFSYGSLPSPAGSVHSSKLTMLTELAEASARLRNALLAMDESALARPLPDEKARQSLPTMGYALMQVVTAHTAYHAGQLAAWRRAIGRAPGGVFV